MVQQIVYKVLNDVHNILLIEIMVGNSYWVELARGHTLHVMRKFISKYQVHKLMDIVAQHGNPKQRESWLPQISCSKLEINVLSLSF